MRDRLLLGPVLIALLVGLFWADEALDHTTAPAWLHGFFADQTTFPPGTVLFLAGVPLLILAARELSAMFKANGIDASRRVMSVAAILGLCVTSLIPDGLGGVRASQTAHTTAAIVLLGALLFHSRKRTFEGVMASAAGALLSYVYLGLLFGFLLAIRREHSAWVVLWVLVVTKSCDIGAFFTGKSIGRRKLIPWLSPGKTWEGLFGGVIFAAMIGAGGAMILDAGGIARISWVAGACAGMLFGMVGQVGDLLESLLKRDSGIKDASSTLPGFGGVLDVLDSPLLVAPVAYWWLAA
ncbi:MAG: phosphatidate cytidylyltransferase [Phycisphaeraceae bacterium]|nr:phosphatidate cytidylyltransferase [Phycisphaeraceae bacterium]